MSLVFDIPGARRIELTDLMVDVNGTLTNRGELIDGVRPRLQKLASRCAVHLVSADTFGTLDGLAVALDVSATRVSDGNQKLDFVDRCGAAACGVIGNGLNDAKALRAAALGVVVLGPEGASPRSIEAADLLCRSIADALDLLADPRALVATIRP
jgi:soluble P-type ATPase